MFAVPDHNRLARHPRARRRNLVFALTAAVATAVGLQGLWPSSTATAAPRITVEQAQRQVAELNHHAEQAAEEFNGTRERIKSLQVLSKAAEQQLVASRSRVQKARQQLGRILVEEYKSGDLSTAKLILSDDPDAYLLAVSASNSLTERRLQALTTLRQEQTALQARHDHLKRQQQKIAEAQQRLVTARGRVRAKLAQAQAVLNSLQSAERARLAQMTRNGARQTLRQILGRDVPARPTCAQAGINPDAHGARVAKVIRYLCAQVGDPYVWGAAGPDSFDCSGLSQQAWLRAGVSLPHNADMQSRYGKRVTAENLMPGDLVFFYRPISHMGIYVGNGLMIAAPQTGDVVKIAPVNYSKLTTAVRL